MAGNNTPSPLNKVYAITNIKTYIPLLLDIDRWNYDAWRALFNTHCKAFDVFDHIDDTMPKSTDDEWQKIDSVIQLWLYGSLSQNTLNMILKDGQSARDIWVSIENLFRSNKDSRAMQLENELRNINMGDLSAAAYFTKAKSLADQLENLGYKVPDKNLVMYTINGLSPKFQHVASIVRHRIPFPSFMDTRDIIALEEQTLNQSRIAPVASHQDHASSPTVLHTGNSNSSRGNIYRNQGRRNDRRQPNVRRRQSDHQQQRYGWVYIPPPLSFQSTPRSGNTSTGHRPSLTQMWPAASSPQWSPAAPSLLGPAPFPQQPNQRPSFTPNQAHFAAVQSQNSAAPSTSSHTWIRNLLRELHCPTTKAIIVYCDNISTVYMSSNPVQHQRTKHIEIDIHFVRDQVATGAIRVLHVPSSSQYADIFTKGLPFALFHDFRSSLNVRQSPVPTAGGC